MSETNNRTGQAPARLSLRDEALLTWYFCEGQSFFERSTFGATLDQQELFAYQTTECARCGGHGFTDDDLRESERRLRDLEFLRQPHEDSEQTQRNFALWSKRSRECSPRCPQCGGKGRNSDCRVDPADTYPYACERCRGTGMNRRGQECPHCEGAGIRGDYDARLLSKGDREPSYTPDDVLLTRYAIASRRLARADESQAGVSAVLGAFYGVLGAKWAAPDPRDEAAAVPGRIFAVFQLTRTGLRWANKQENPHNLAVHEILGNDWIAHSKQPSTKRQLLFDACRTEAEELYRLAVRVWIGAQQPTRESGWREHWDAIKVRATGRSAA